MPKKRRFTLATIVGARPQFIKAAAFSRVWRRHHAEILIHTGQHYDREMSDIFFRELEIPHPDYNLGIDGPGHGGPTGRMLAALEPLLRKIKPDGVIVYGDTNSTLAGALAAAKLHIPVFHIEAGLRSFRKTMPEEINRVTTDHLSDLLFAPTALAVKNLSREGLRKGVYRVGDIMGDAFRYYRSTFLSLPFSIAIPHPYLFVTIHRAETTDNPNILRSLCRTLNHLPLPVVWPIHPRTQKALRIGNIFLGKNITVLKPVGYLESIRLQAEAELILTDSGGIQKEAYFLRKPCVVLRRETEWKETLKTGHNALGGFTLPSVLAAYHRVQSYRHAPWPVIFGRGNISEKIAARIILFLAKRRGLNGIDTAQTHR